MPAEPVIDFFEKLLSAFVEIGLEFCDRIGMDAIVDCKTLEPTLVGIASYVVAQRIGVVKQVGAKKPDASCVHFDRHVIAALGDIVALRVLFDRSGVEELSKQCLLWRIAAIGVEK